MSDALDITDEAAVRERLKSDPVAKYFFAMGRAETEEQWRKQAKSLQIIGGASTRYSEGYNHALDDMLDGVNRQ